MEQNCASVRRTSFQEAAGTASSRAVSVEQSNDYVKRGSVVVVPVLPLVVVVVFPVVAVLAIVVLELADDRLRAAAVGPSQSEQQRLVAVAPVEIAIAVTV